MTRGHILQGYDDGLFHPELTLTREQGAKIITYLMLGSEQAEKLACTTAPYTDVTADRWSAACIAWYTEHDILAGYGDGTYGPADQLTGQQFAKMLLCAYKIGEQARYLGDNWAEKVGEDGTVKGLFTGDVDMNSDKPLQRQQAALMADNARKAASSRSSSDGSGSSSPDSSSSADNGSSSGSSSGNGGTSGGFSSGSSSSSSGSNSGNGSASGGSHEGNSNSSLSGSGGGASDSGSSSGISGDASNGGSIGDVETPEIDIVPENQVTSQMSTESISENDTARNTGADHSSDVDLNDDTNQDNAADQGGTDTNTITDSNGDIMLPEAS